MSEEERSHYQPSWWDSWGKMATFLVLGIFGFAAATIVALIIAGVIL